MNVKKGDRINVSFTVRVYDINLEVKASGERLFVSMDHGLVYLDELDGYEDAVIEPYLPPS